MKELLRKKSVKISLLLIILLVVLGIVGINVRSAQRNKEYDAHIAAAEKYLTELDYEQAIAEYTMAFEIDPKEEVVDALEQTYLAYAQTCIDAGDYERAVSILEEGYEKIGRESLQNKKEEFQVMQEEIRIQEAQLQEQKRLEEEQRRIEEEQRQIEEEEQASGMVEFPFRMADITVMGYDLFGNHYAKLKEQILADSVERYEWDSNAGRMPDGWYFSIMEDPELSEGTISMCNHGRDMGHCWQYNVWSGSDGLHFFLDLSHEFDHGEINVPVASGVTYEDWCRVMQIDRIKENNLRPEERDGIVGIWEEDVLICGEPWLAEESNECWCFSTEWYQGIYCEFDTGDGSRGCEFLFSEPGVYRSSEEWTIQLIHATINSAGVIENIYYEGRAITE